MWKEIRRLRQHVGSRASAPKRESLFSLVILEERLPPNFRHSDVGECRVFLGTLVRSAQQWFNTLQPNSIQSFEDFSTAFLHRFASSKRHQKNYLSLFLIKQQETEILREFVQRFKSAALEIPAATPDIMISSFTQRPKGGEFFKPLVKKPPSSYDDLLSRAKKYVNLEDAQRHKRMEQRHGGNRVEGAKRRGRKRGTGERDEDKARGATDRDSGRTQKAHGRRLENFEIYRDADLSQDPVISFGPEDLRGVVAPHNDALVVTAFIANYDVVEGFEFEPVSTPLYGFAGHTIPPLGQIVIPLSLGNDPRRVTKMITFTVVDIPSSYNGILGRPALKDFGALASTYHQKLKFSVGKGIGVLCGDQKVVRRCYERIVKKEEKRGHEHCMEA
ncbi:uncharacterized protein [Primulina huaijiensis]|uniref:uncharacterized protein n=1 Tax=Primulina huaijiensis TaxID=1492673 RepID=UPI003CC75946